MKIKAAVIPMLRKVIRQPICRPMARPMGIPNTIAMDEPVATRLSAMERWRSETIRAAIGETMAQKTEWEQATPILDTISMP